MRVMGRVRGLAADLQEEGEHHEEEHKVDVFEEMHEVLRVAIYLERGPLEDTETEHEVGVEGDEAEHRQLAEHRLQDRRHHRGHVVLEMVLRHLKDDGHTDEHYANAERRLQIERGVDVAVELAVVLRRAVRRAVRGRPVPFPVPVLRHLHLGLAQEGHESEDGANDHIVF